MNQPAVLLVCAVLATASSLATCQNSFIVKYLDFSLEWGRSNIEVTREVLLVMDIKQGELPINILRKIEYWLNPPPGFRTIVSHRSVYEDLFHLTISRREFTKRELKCLMDMCKILIDPSFRMRNELANFLLVYGKTKFSKMITNTNDRLTKGTRGNNHIYRELDQIYEASMGLMSCQDDVVLEILKNLDLATSDLDVDRMLQVALKLEVWNELMLKKPTSIILDSILKRCEILQTRTKFDTYVLTLASILGVSSEYLSIKVQKIREYNRLCSSARLDQSRVIPNLARQINCMDWPNQAVVDLDQLFAAFFNLQAYDDKVMLKSLRKLDLTSSEINVDAAAEVALNMGSWNEAERKKPLVIVFDLISRKCDELQSGREFHMNQLNLAGTFNFPSESFKTEVNKWREYNRLCASLSHKKNMVFDNLARHINWMDWPNQAVVDLDQLFAAFFNLQAYDDKVMLQILSQFDWTTSKIDINKAAEVALNMGSWNEEERNNPMGIVSSLISSKCGQLQSGREFQTNHLTLVNTFHLLSEKIQIEVNKWSAYSEICNNFLRNESEISNSLSRQANMQDWHGQAPDQPITRDFLSKIN